MRGLILGGGVTGLAAGIASAFPIFEATEVPGGICSSYYMRPGDHRRLAQAPASGDAYRFEIGGGHWIFGGDRLVLQAIRSLTPLRSYARQSAVFFPDRQLLVPYPIQNHLRAFGAEVAARALSEMCDSASRPVRVTTMQEWLRSSFGATLCDIFFEPFHNLYTAGLYKQIAPQDAYKSPVDLKVAIGGAFGDSPSVGYNATFLYPEGGLNVLTEKMASRCDIRYGKLVTKVNVEERSVSFEDGSTEHYDILLSTLPLSRIMQLSALDAGERSDPSTSVLVANIGALKGSRCPRQHWLYVPSSKCGFHRVGFYSNVDASFLPFSASADKSHVSIYVEKAYSHDSRPASAAMNSLCADIVAELQAWRWIQDAEVVDPTWIEVAYTWSWPSSRWLMKAFNLLARHRIYQVGRFARWSFQGIADSIRDGLVAGACVGQKIWR